MDEIEGRVAQIDGEYADIINALETRRQKLEEALALQVGRSGVMLATRTILFPPGLGPPFFAPLSPKALNETKPHLVSSLPSFCTKHCF